MSAARSIRGTLWASRNRNALSPTRLTPFLTIPQGNCRLNSTASILPLEVPSTTGDEHTVLTKKALRRPEYRTKDLNQVVGEEWTIKQKCLEADTKELAVDLHRIFRTGRRLRKVLKSNDYHVQTEPLDVDGGKTINVDKGDLMVGGTKIPNLWLRDNCQCSSCVHESTKQRLLDTFSIPEDISLRKFTFNEEKTLSVKWSDGHKSEYSSDFLSATVQNAARRAITRQGLTRLKLWGAEIADQPPHIFNNVDLSVRDMLRKIRKFGFVFVHDVDHPDPAATEALLKKIAFIRETHYGGFYDFTADLASADTAYTNIALEAHTDNTYFSDPAGLQAFHLLSHTDGEGGASLLVDGFKVAHELYQQDRDAYQVLSTVNVHAHASGNNGISIQPYRGFPVLEHDPSTNELLRVRWNNSDRASIELPIEDVGTWYDAARKFDALLKKKENEYWEQLQPGRVLIFDNWRVLHGRSSFTGKRRICGGYINRDDWISRYKMESVGREKVLRALASG
ncbi:Trimethyllysine dioxygenase [Ophiobolus disseminans]|uniref:Trimethyllysine dioxygenase n=1 Tax=Ophiobolus disseminans TaxID=1469910 RepID=A0A6A7A6V6_9PLEO|nr:Trimethyllysine dioxygenase [Ophiobolus disseminans]